MTSACILGCSGLELTPEECALFRDARPWGFILFKRNVGDPDQVRALVQSFRDCVGRPDAPVLIDQEGGRVQRLGPPHWRRYPTGRAYGLAGGGDPMRRRELARLGGRLLAHDLKALGITVDCAPVLDTPQPGAHDVIGDRAYGQDWPNGGRARPGGLRGPAGRRRPAGDQARARPRPRRRRQSPRPAGGGCALRGSGADRLPPVPGAAPTCRWR